MVFLQAGCFAEQVTQVGATALSVTSLGRFAVAGNTGTHTVKLVQSNGTDLPGATVSINLANATPANTLMPLWQRR